LEEGGLGLKFMRFPENALHLILALTQFVTASVFTNH